MDTGGQLGSGGPAGLGGALHEAVGVGWQGFNRPGLSYEDRVEAPSGKERSQL